MNTKDAFLIPSSFVIVGRKTIVGGQRKKTFTTLLQALDRPP